MKNKKAQSGIIMRKTWYILIISVLLAVLFLYLTWSFFKYDTHLTRISPQIESTILSSRFINSPNCFAYQDPITERVYPGLIDLDRFNNKIIQECYYSNTTKHYQFQLKLTDLKSKDTQTIQTKEWYNVPSFTLTQPVQIKKQNEVLNGQLLIFVQKPI